MRLLRTRVLTITVAATAAAFSAAGCGAGDAADSAKNAVDPVAQAAEVTSAQDGGIAMTMKGTMSVGGQDIAMDGSGVMARDGKAGTMSMTTAIGGQTIKMEEIVAKHVVYVRSDAFKGKLPGGKEWMKVDLDSALAKEGIDLDAITGAGQQGPDQLLAFLQGAGTSKKIGSETVAGTPTTHYRVDVDLRKAAAKGSAEAKKSVEALIKQAGVSEIPVDVWVDAHHLVRRESMKYDTTIQGQKGAMAMTMDFTKFGVPIAVKPPADGDTMDMSDLLTSKSATVTG